jgi:hypothetical protein
VTEPKSQMVVGFNHNIKHKGRIYHIQTEDSGAQNPHIITHLFVGGNILATKKTSYADIVQADNLQQIVRELMEEQHKAMLRNLINGVYDDIDGTGTAAQGPPSVPIQAPSATPEPKPAAQPAPRPEPQSPVPQPVPKPIPQTPVTPAVQQSPQAPEPQAPVTVQAKPPAQPAPAQAETQPEKFPPPAPPGRTQTAIPKHEAATLPAMQAATGKVTGTQIHKPPPPETVPIPAKQAQRVTIRPKDAATATGQKTQEPAPTLKPRIQPPPVKPIPPVVSPEASQNLPPEVIAARRLVDRPVPKDTAGPTIFGEDLISEKSLDEVILGYLSGEGEEGG